MREQFLTEPVRNDRRCAGHLFGELNAQLLQVRELVAVAIVHQGDQLLFREPLMAAEGVGDVDAELAVSQHRRFRAREHLERGGRPATEQQRYFVQPIRRRDKRAPDQPTR